MSLTPFEKSKISQLWPPMFSMNFLNFATQPQSELQIINPNFLPLLPPPLPWTLIQSQQVYNKAHITNY
ncbi:hypothetical protein PSTT_14904 [Puccinia striiformis]|uniref:Uncharacterized protein n=1 Tax=Puccinia striiformis TaxID=27350 RepID=A0A2S4UKE3_9BASI|nr:hypothetical protein PSTT_14904 [Puccinia striiformis]